MGTKVNQMMTHRKWRRFTTPFLLIVAGLTGAPGLLSAQDAQPSPPSSSYLVSAGDLLQVSVWKEEYLERDVLVRPDGGISFPLAGDVQAAGLPVTRIRDALAAQLSRFIPDPVVTVSIKEIRGNRVYVLGQVNRPGPIIMNPRVDVMQALAMAGGTTAFAALNDIKILRRSAGSQRIIGFRYGDVAKGRNLEQNVMLESGDIIVVP
jgi:polysaccharide export outer membrane protein